MIRTHLAHLDGTDATGWRVVCACGWISRPMGLGNAWFTKEHVETDRGHVEYSGPDTGGRREAR